MTIQAIDHSLVAAKDIERLWIVRLLTALTGMSVTLGLWWLQNMHAEMKTMRRDLTSLALTIGTVQSRQDDVRSLNAEQSREIRSLMDRMARHERKSSVEP